MKLDAGTFLLQWATGGLAGCWITTRRREVGLGYGWLLRTIFGVLAALGAYALGHDGHTALAVVTWAVAGAAFASLGMSAGKAVRATGVETFDPRLDLVAPLLGTIGLFAAADVTGGGYVVALLRLAVGAAFLGAVSDAMLLGHWYLVQPGLRRDPLIELVHVNLALWPLEVAAMLLPTGMLSVINGSIDDGYYGLLGWIWIACAVFTIGLVYVTRIALRERYYSAVMSATGLLYLAILTAFGTDLIARAVLAP